MKNEKIKVKIKKRTRKSSRENFDEPRFSGIRVDARENTILDGPVRIIAKERVEKEVIVVDIGHERAPIESHPRDGIGGHDFGRRLWHQRDLRVHLREEIDADRCVRVIVVVELIVRSGLAV